MQELQLAVGLFLFFAITYVVVLLLIFAVVFFSGGDR